MVPAGFKKKMVLDTFLGSFMFVRTNWSYGFGTSVFHIYFGGSVETCLKSCAVINVRSYKKKSNWKPDGSSVGSINKNWKPLTDGLKISF